MKTASANSGPNLSLDVLVVGGGPAGTATAIECRRRGLSVCVIEQAGFPRRAPGETLHPGVATALRQLGVWDDVQSAITVRPRGCRVIWNGLDRVYPYGGHDDDSWRGCHLFRSDLDAALLRRAAALGADILQPCRALDVVMRDDRVCGIVTSRGTVFARWVVDATGRNGWLSRRLRLDVQRCSPAFVATYGYVRAKSGDRPDEDLATLRADDRGWTWTAKVSSNLEAWVRLTLAADRPCRAWRPPALADRRPVGETRYADVTWREVVHPASAGYFVVGDAAALLDPARSSGVLKALTSGMVTASCIAANLHHRAPDEVACGAYSQHVRASFAADVNRLSDSYSVFSWWQPWP
jgi:flavin-dependent dehydrogenase